VVPNRAGKLRPGMFATVRVAAGETTVPIVPATAIRAGDTGNGDRLFVVTGDRLEERVVQCGDRQGDDVTVTNGVRAGEQVVTRLTTDVRDGARVTRR
jgi:multidrug efflux pump subunit AcrA (membrane-fusion protein)